MKILFDLDGPILNVIDRYYTIYTSLLKEGGYTTLCKREYWELKRGCIAENEILRRTCSEKFIEFYIPKRVKIIEDFNYLKLDSIHEGVLDIFKDWHVKHDMYIVTMRKNRNTLIKQLNFLMIYDYFTNIYSKEGNDGTWKVKHELIDMSVGNHKECIIIGDTEADVKAGKALGIKTVAVTCGIRSRDLLKKAKPDYIFDNVKSIPLKDIMSGV